MLGIPKMCRSSDWRAVPHRRALVALVLIGGVPWALPSAREKPGIAPLHHRPGDRLGYSVVRARPMPCSIAPAASYADHGVQQTSTSRTKPTRTTLGTWVRAPPRTMSRSLGFAPQCQRRPYGVRTAWPGSLRRSLVLGLAPCRPTLRTASLFPKFHDSIIQCHDPLRTRDRTTIVVLLVTVPPPGAAQRPTRERLAHRIERR